MLEHRQWEALHGLFEANRAALGIAGEINVSLWTTFIGVALWGHNDKKRDPLTFNALGRKIGLPYTTVSRHMRYLGEWRQPGVPGLGLIKADIWVLNQRQKYAYLTPKGQRLVEQMVALLT